MKKGPFYGKLQSKFIGLASVLWLEVSFVEVRYNTCEVLLMLETKQSIVLFFLIALLYILLYVLFVSCTQLFINAREGLGIKALTLNINIDGNSQTNFLRFKARSWFHYNSYYKLTDITRALVGQNPIQQGLQCIVYWIKP